MNDFTPEIRSQGAAPAGGASLKEIASKAFESTRKAINNHIPGSYAPGASNEERALRFASNVAISVVFGVLGGLTYGAVPVAIGLLGLGYVAFKAYEHAKAAKGDSQVMKAMNGINDSTNLKELRSLRDNSPKNDQGIIDNEQTLKEISQLCEKLYNEIESSVNKIDLSKASSGELEKLHSLLDGIHEEIFAMEGEALKGQMPRGAEREKVHVLMSNLEALRIKVGKEEIINNLGGLSGLLTSNEGKLLMEIFNQCKTGDVFIASDGEVLTKSHVEGSAEQIKNFASKLREPGTIETSRISRALKDMFKAYAENICKNVDQSPDKVDFKNFKEAVKARDKNNPPVIPEYASESQKMAFKCYLSIADNLSSKEYPDWKQVERDLSALRSL
ncbi:MAG: hypothetical protein JSR46_06510 [Verrucomicrobia bacterium]|nr:hypothetical protein [Verrucomicrobiota bacterium]